MGKRTRTESSDYDHLAKKLKKLEKSLSRARRKKNASSSSSSSSLASSSRSSSPPRRQRSRSRSLSQQLPQEQLCIEDLPIQYKSAMPSTSKASEPPRALSQAGVRPSLPDLQHQQPTQKSSSDAICAEGAFSSPNPPPAVSELDGDMLELLGDDPSRIEMYGKAIQPDLAVRLNYIATSGLSKENRKELIEKYLVPENSKLIGAPMLNPELKAAISEAVLKKDRAIELKQKQLASAISCLAEALTVLLSAEVKNAPIIKLLMDASKILCDSQNADSNTRKAFVQFNIKKEFKDHLKNTKIDEFLFGKDVAETLKVAKTINKSASDIKVPLVKQLKSSTQKAPQKNLNWRGPPQSYRPKGTQRTKEPVPKNRQESSSRQSSRAAPKYNRHRR